MEKKLGKVVFIHSLFRAGSTYIYSKVRDNNGFHCYYEPLHHVLANLRRDALDVWAISKRASSRAKHPFMAKPHFYEYHRAFDPLIGEQLPYFNGDYSYNEFFSVVSHDGMHRYIDNLIDSSPKHIIPLFQFNRTSLRIEWFKRAYPSSLNIFLLRNPRDQFESYYRMMKLKQNSFLAINLVIIKNGIDYIKNESLRGKIDTINIKLGSGDAVLDVQSALEFVPLVHPGLHYEIFFDLWLKSFIEAGSHSDFIIDMDKMGGSPEYTASVNDRLNAYNPECNIDFSDFKIKKYLRHLLGSKEYDDIERPALEANSEYGFLQDYISNMVGESYNKKSGLFGEMFGI